MKFYCVTINGEPACVIHDQMADSDIQAAIEQELDCMELEIELITIERSENGAPVIVGSENGYDTCLITVHGINPVTGQVN